MPSNHRTRRAGAVALLTVAALMASSVPTGAVAPTRADGHSPEDRVVVVFDRPLSAGPRAVEVSRAAAARLADDPGVVAVEEPITYRADLGAHPNDPCDRSGPCAGQSAWHVDDIGLRKLWRQTHGAGTVVAIIDCGTDVAAAEIAPKARPQINVTVEAADASDHGTYTASLAAAVTDNGVGIPGVARDAEILPLKALIGIPPDPDGPESCTGSSVDIAHAIDLAVAGGADVINMSLSSPDAGTAVPDAVADALAAGVVVVASAGNNGSSQPTFPASLPGVISVGASTEDRTIASFSNRGDWVDVYAPGTLLPVIGRLGELEVANGTSMSSAVVSGVVALMLAHSPGLSPAEVRSRIIAASAAIPGGRRLRAGPLVGMADVLPAAANSPFGSIDSVKTGINRVKVAGWALDPNTAQPIDVHLLRDGQLTRVLTALTTRHDVANVHRGYGPRHGFRANIDASSTPAQLCSVGINRGAGLDATTACRTISIPDDPLGKVTVLGRRPAGIVVEGWALDANTGDNLSVHHYVDGSFASSAPARRPRQLADQFPDHGDDHGFRRVLTPSVGRHRICVYAINKGPGTNRLLRCKTLTYSHHPFGAVETAKTTPNGVRIEGWAIDPDVADSIDVIVRRNGKVIATVDARRRRPDVARANPGYGERHGFRVDHPSSGGTFCATAVNRRSGANQGLGCVII